MFRIMSFSTIIVILLCFLCQITLQQNLPPKYLNPERIMLLKKVLSWVNFKKNGNLASEADLEPFFQTLKDQYSKSKYYRTTVIAFSRGVIPKLTLNENDPCDPAYTLEYRDSHNNSVTEGQIKTFILKSYDARGDVRRQYCDYRKGLVCNQKTSKCECPLGSKMEPVSQGSAEKMCFVQENEICSLLDLDHDPSSNYGALKMRLPWMVFNLEKPLSCKMGTQCRFKSANPLTPLCYGVNNGPWDKGRWDIDFGEECTLGLYGDTGQCINNGILDYTTGGFGGWSGYTCFNFGPRSQPKSPFIGFCAFDLGSYSHVGSVRHSDRTGFTWDLGTMAFVSPATTPLRGHAFRDYMRRFLQSLDGSFNNNNGYSAMASYPGNNCTISKTEKKLELWKFFKSLEETPPPGKDYVATEAELWVKFNETKALTVDKKKMICRFRSDFYRATEHALRCIKNPNSTVDKDGNDGKCEVIPENEDVTYSWAKAYSEYQTRMQDIFNTENYAESVYRKDIFEPELECDPDLGPPPGSQNATPSTDNDVLEGGYCPPDRGCFEDYADKLEIYDKDCNLKNPKPKLYRNCQLLDDKRGFRGCERKQLNQLYKEEILKLTSYSGLERGHACNLDIEAKVRKWITLDVDSRWTDDNRYKLLIDLYKFNRDIGGKGLCDRTKLLECSSSGICECLKDSQPREVVLEADTIYSDYCYLTSGVCRPYDTNFAFDSISELERIEINTHYKPREGQGGGNGWYTCKDSNWCVFTDHGGAVCTTENTGDTGYDGSEPVTTGTTTVRSTTSRGKRTTTRRDDGNLKCVGDKCGWQDAGVARNEIHEIFEIIILIKLLRPCFEP